MRAEASDDPDCQVGQQRSASRRLPRKDVGQVHFNKGNVDGEKRIAHGNRSMGKRSGVYECTVGTTRKALHQFYKLSLVIRLRPVERDSQLVGTRLYRPFDICEPVSAVELGFSGTQEIEVGTVEDRDTHLGLETLEPVLEVLRLRPFRPLWSLRYRRRLRLGTRSRLATAAEEIIKREVRGGDGIGYVR